MGDEHELQPDAVVLEVAERHLGEPGVLVVADVVLDVRAGAVAALQERDVAVGLVGQGGLEAVAVVVGEGELRAGMGAFAPNQDA